MSRNVIAQYIYMKEQYILGMGLSEDLKRAAELHLKQLLALQAILEEATSTVEHVKLVLPYLCDEFEAKLAPHVRDKFDREALKEETTQLIEATSKILQD